jgi:hypothetical protein
MFTFKLVIENSAVAAKAVEPSRKRPVSSGGQTRSNDPVFTTFPTQHIDVSEHLLEDCSCQSKVDMANLNVSES